MAKEPKMYSEFAVKFMIAEAIYRYVSEIDFITPKFPKSLSSYSEKIIKEFDDAGK